SYLVLNIHSDKSSPLFNFLNGVVPENLKWVSLYWVFALIALAMTLIVFLAKFPKVELKADEKTGSRETFSTLVGNKYVILFFLGILCYVGTEQGVANWASK